MHTDDENHQSLSAWAHQQDLEQQEQEQEQAMNIDDMKQSKYLKKEDVGKGVLVTVKGLTQANVAMDNDIPDIKWLMTFHELEKPLVLNSTNIQLCAAAFNSKETDTWMGKQVVLYTDPNVSYAGKLIGGIRTRAPKTNTPPPVMERISAPDFDDDIPF